jgi:hypothetical protein
MTFGACISLLQSSVPTGQSFSEDISRHNVNNRQRMERQKSMPMALMS